MLVVKILLFISVFYLAILILVPRGYFLYELVRLPLWILRLKSFPVGNYKETKIKYGRHFRQYFLFFQPKNNESERRHVVIYFHGGGWQFGSPEMFRPNAQALVDEGFFVFMPSHRRLPFFNCEHMRADAADAVKKIVEIMHTEGVAGKKIILGGMSSGANLAGLLALDGRVLESRGLSPNIFSALFLLGAPVNLEGMWASPPLRLLAGKRSGKRFRNASPMCHLPSKNSDMPILLVHGEKDGLVEYRSVVAFFEKIKYQPMVRFETLPGGIHTDSASWCFTDHPCRKIVMEWLLDLERQESAG